MKGDIVYEVDATNVKIRHQIKRVFEIIFILGYQILLLILLFSFLEWYAIPTYILGVLLFFPSPYIRIPDMYKITKKGLIYSGKRIFRLKKKHKLRMNKKDEFVSIASSLGQEFLRLYTPEPDRVYKILNNLIVNMTE